MSPNDLDDFFVREETPEEKAKKARQALELENFFVDLFNNPHGVDALFYILNMTGILGQSSFSTCDRMQAYNEGRRSIGAMIFKTLQEHCPHLLYGEMSKRTIEQNNERKAK